ncbi:MAG: hypothetical protein ACC645_13815, partial [Pirellulales bacterium]
AGLTAGRSFKLGGFDVRGAVRQSGYLAVDVIGDWYVRWGEMDGAIRVEDLPEPLRRGDHAARFQYYHHPFSLRGQVVRRKTSVRVEPEYLLLVADRDVELTARLRYRVRVKKIVAVELDLPGWKIEPGSIGPDDVFDVDAMAATVDGHLRIPLRSPRQGSFQLQFKARKSDAGDRERVDFALPVPLDCLAAPSTVVVLPDDNVQLVPQSESTVGLTPQRIAPLVDLPPRQQAAFYYQGDPEKTRFVALRRTHPRAVTTRVSAQLMVHADRVVVEETISVDVAYEPLESVDLRVSRLLLPGDQVDFRLAGQRLQATFLEDTGAAVDAGQRTGETEEKPAVVDSTGGSKPTEPSRNLPKNQAGSLPRPDHDSVRSNLAIGSKTLIARLVLPKPTIGAFQIVARYEFPRRTPSADANEAERLPLLVPCDAVERTAIALEVPPAWRIAVADDAWGEQQAAHDQEPRAGNSLQIVADGPQPFVPVQLRRADSVLPRTVVDRLWVQTWLGDGVRRDRAVYRFERLHRNHAVRPPRPGNDVRRGSLGTGSRNVAPNLPTRGRFSENRSTELGIVTASQKSGTQWTFSLPTGVRRDRITVTLDGQIVTATLNRQNQLIVLAGTDASDVPGCLVLTYEVSCNRLRGPLDMELPMLEGNPWIRQTFWELVLPENLHLVRGPAQFVREHVWEMNQFFWTRRPALTTGQLEAWAGVSAELPMPEHVHRYLFSRLGALDHVVVWTASRATLVLLSSGLVLVVGLLWIYRPSIRRTGFLFVLGVVLLGFGMASPDIALLFLQASILGIVLAVLAAVLRQLVMRRDGASRTVVHSGGSSIVAPVATTEIHLPAASAGDASSGSTRISARLQPSEVAPPTDGA